MQQHPSTSSRAVPDPAHRAVEQRWCTGTAFPSPIPEILIMSAGPVLSIWAQQYGTWVKSVMDLKFH